MLFEIGDLEIISIEFRNNRASTDFKMGILPMDLNVFMGNSPRLESVQTRLWFRDSQFNLNLV